MTLVYNLCKAINSMIINLLNFGEAKFIIAMGAITIGHNDDEILHSYAPEHKYLPSVLSDFQQD